MEMLYQKIFAAVVVLDPLPKPGADSNALKAATSEFFVLTGAISLLIITIAGFRYIVSHGDPKLISQSKNAILYAVIGLIVSLTAFSIVNFVIGSL